MKQKLVEQSVRYLHTLPKDERVVAMMDIALNVMNNVGLTPMEIVGVGNCIRMELERDIMSSRESISVTLNGQEN